LRHQQMSWWKIMRTEKYVFARLLTLMIDVDGAESQPSWLAQQTLRFVKEPGLEAAYLKILRITEHQITTSWRKFSC